MAVPAEAPRGPRECPGMVDVLWVFAVDTAVTNLAMAHLKWAPPSVTVTCMSVAWVSLVLVSRSGT